MKPPKAKGRRSAREILVGRGRFLACQGCPTVDCTCMSELEQALLDSGAELIRATGQPTIVPALAWVRRQRRLADRRERKRGKR